MTAVMHLGRDMRLDRPVAIKRLLPEALAGPEGGRTAERFEREVQAIASLNHRNVVAVCHRTLISCSVGP